MTAKEAEKQYNTRTVHNIVSNCSSKIKEVRSVLEQLGLRKPPVPFVNASPGEAIDVNMVDQEGYRNITRSVVRLYAEMLNTCAQTTAKARKQHENFNKKLNTILAKPFSPDEYQNAYNCCPMSQDEYLAAEREACIRLYQETTEFTLLIAILFASGPFLLRVPESLVLRLLKEMGCGTDTTAST